MKIGFTTPAWPGSSTANGITTAVSFLTEGLEQLGHDVIIIPLTDCLEDDRRVFRLPSARKITLFDRVLARFLDYGPASKIIAERIVTAAQEAIRTCGMEILVMEESYGLAGLVQRRLSIPVIVTLHGPFFIQMDLQPTDKIGVDSNKRIRMEGRALRQCAAITSPSQDVLDRTREKFGKLTPLQAVIANPISLETPIDYDHLSGKDQQRILFVGRFDSWKGGDIVLDGFSRLILMGADAHLTFIGPDNGVEQVAGGKLQIAEALHALPPEVRARIIYLGPCSKQEIAKQRQHHAITVVASRHENFPYTLLESLAAGTATVSTSAGGPSEIIQDGKTGLLIAPDDPGALAQACWALLQDPGLTKAIGKAARDEISDRFAPTKIGQQMVEFMQKVIDQSEAVPT